jgi:hypothetical protein
MAKPEFLVRVTPAMRTEFDALLAALKDEVPKAWRAPSQGDLVGALVVLVREAKTRAKLKDGLDTYYNEKG